jgi:signal transduction histidine kinase
MRPLKEWLKPPRTLLLILFLLTLVSVSAMTWFGWKLLDQERLVEAQRAQERLEQVADRVAATLRGTLAETGEVVGAWLASPPSVGAPPGGLVLRLSENTMAAFPAGRLLYYPFPRTEPEARPAIFNEGEGLEFQQAQPGKALVSYQRLADSSNAAIRAGALMRVARVLRNLGRRDEARAVYTRLAALSGAAIAGTPAELVARHALCELARDPAATRTEAGALAADLLRARWHLTRGQFEFYWDEAARLAGSTAAPRPEALALSEAASLAWEARKRNPAPRGQETVWAGGLPFFFIWRGAPERRAVLIIGPGELLQQTFAGETVSCAVVDAEGRLVAGQRGRGGHAAVRTVAETQLPWTLFVSGAQPLDEAGRLARQRFLLLGIGVMATFLVLGTYFIARAIRRENEVARMQSDFVSGVSHEFRSPLTSIRQLSEILALGRVPSEERRQVYYDTLVQETGRLQRLVESLLNFGRMEAGGRLYRFEELDAVALVRRVAAEFAPQATAAGRHIELVGDAGACPIQADPEALAVALRNLVDNALKYSPGCDTIWVEWASARPFVAIRVRDRGAGITDAEKKAIFKKFVRGSAASTTNVKGSGVGLTMVRHIVAAHRGEIMVTSTPGQGSTFTMLLPAAGEA